MEAEQDASRSTKVIARQPAVAGSFYPAHPDRLRRQVTDLLAGASATAKTTPKAVIAPHAGYAYSGQIAGDCAARTEREGRLTSRGNRMEGDGGRANKKAQGGVIGGTHLAWA